MEVIYNFSIINGEVNKMFTPIKKLLRLIDVANKNNENETRKKLILLSCCVKNIKKIPTRM